MWKVIWGYKEGPSCWYISSHHEESLYKRIESDSKISTDGTDAFEYVEVK